MSSRATESDPILVSVIGNRLYAISDEIGQTMLRTSRSPIFSEARDFVTGIFDHRLRLLAQTAYIPVLMGTLPSALRSIVDEFTGDIAEGDVFILNDPYRGNNHPPDITVAKPVFVDGAIQFWAVSKGHHADVGGGGVVGYNPTARTVWEECLRIPPAKLMVKGKRNRTLWDMVLINVRMPWLVEADLECQIGACTVGERSLRALIDKYGVAVLDDVADSILDASDRQMRAALRKIPNGIYEAERHIDNDGIDTDRMIALRLKLTVHEESLHFDWSGSDPQAAGYVNSTLTNTISASYQAIFMTVCSGVRYNEGALRSLSVQAPAGTVVNALEPAPVTACTVVASQTIVETVWLALSQVAPERVYASWGRWLAPATMGFNPRTGRPFGDIHFMGKSGTGAAKGFDGWDHRGAVITAGGLRAPDPELHELVNPYRVLRYEYWPDSAGAGQWRGGMGTIYRWRSETDGVMAANFGGGVREETRPFGLMGGQAGPIATLTLYNKDGEHVIGTEAFFAMNKGDEVEIHAAGGGGYGDPQLRDPALIAKDVANGLVSPAQARALYGAELPG
ncbi:MAG: hydantoinase B/oxoprolinase family protein [Alphaproteobacteria bacterium]|nr:hydantoinase B/oxoprolinase family protein [Alphaproteobacteria bacterium]